jgi:hypothetical protein
MTPFKLNEPLIAISEETLLLAISNALTARDWDTTQESKSYYQGQIDAYNSLLKGML